MNTFGTSVRRRLFAGVAVALLSMGGAVAVEPTTATTQRSILVLHEPQQQIAAISAPTSALQASVFLDRPSGTYAIGDRLRLFVNVTQDAYVRVISTDAQGVSTEIFPNRFATDNLIRAGAAVEISGRGGAGFQVGGPTGTDLITVIATGANIDPTTGLASRREGDYRELLGGPQVVSRSIQVVLDRPQTTAGASVTKLTYQVVDRVPAAATPAVAPERPRLTLSTDKEVYRIGEEVRINVSSADPCYLQVINVDPRGQATQLFPNLYQQDSRLTAGATLSIPAAASGVSFRVMGPEGNETLHARCFSAPFSFTGSITEPYPNLGPATRALAVVGPANPQRSASAGFVVVR